MAADMDCFGCKVQREPGKKILTPRLGKSKTWVANNFGSSPQLIGYLALQPVEHRRDVSELSDKEVADLGLILKQLDRIIRRLWPQVVNSGDQIETIYIVSFMETQFDEGNTDMPHFHFHVIPRSNRLAKLIRRDYKGTIQNVGWDAHDIARRIRDRDGENLVNTISDNDWDSLQTYIDEVRLKEFMQQLNSELSTITTPEN